MSNSRRKTSLSPLLLSLFYQLYQHLESSSYKPPVTLALLCLNVLAFLHPQAHVLGHSLHDISSNCLLPSHMLSTWQRFGEYEWNRLLLSAIIHADDLHLYYNMLSLCWKGVQLEKTLGSWVFLQLVVFSWVVSHSLLVFLASILFYGVGLDAQLSGFNSCAVGFSAVLFSLKYVWNSSCDNYSSVMGFSVPTKYAAWLELVLISLMSPNASFLGHLSGILAGFIYVKGPIEVMLLLPRWLVSTWRKLFLSSQDYEPEIELEDINDMRDPLDVRFPDDAELRQQRLRRFANRYR